MIGIYKITNLINNKSYIGQSINIEKRWYEHKYKSQCNNDNSFNSILHMAFRKYGIENFKIEVIEELKTPEQLDEKERYYINFYNTITPYGYNILEGGQKIRSKIKYCKNCGKVLKYSKTQYCLKCCHILQHKCTHPSKDILLKMIALNGFEKTGRIYGVSGSTIKKWCKKQQLPFYKKDILKLYNSINNISNEKKSISPKKVVQLNKNTNEIIREFNSAYEAGKFLGKGNSHIVEVCNGKQKTAYGFKWEYLK